LFFLAFKVRESQLKEIFIQTTGDPYLSTGHILRQIAKEKTQTWRYIKETINAGILVPDHRMIPIVDQYYPDRIPKWLYSGRFSKDS
jgi:adenylate kinase family enzyme